MAHLASITKEYLYVPVTENDEAPDPSYTPEIAVLPVGEKEEPESGDWITATWDNGEAKILIGESGKVLENGYYDVWIRVTTPAEKPVRRVGRVRVT